VPRVSDAALVALFAGSAAVSLAASWLLVNSLERAAARLGLTEALLGVVAALAADAPEITTAVTALVRHQTRTGAGVVLGSNVFNLAALLGLSAVVAGRVGLHRRAIELGGAVALWVAAACLLAVAGVLSPVAGLAVVAIVLLPYGVLLGASIERLARLRLPSGWGRWLGEAIREEEVELADAIHPAPGGLRDGVLALAAVGVVVGASIAMERSASTLGAHHGVSEIVIGGIVLAVATSLPNAVAGVYLASRGRGRAALSTALNSNAINVVAGLLLPGAIVGLGATSGQALFVAGSYLALTAGTLASAYRQEGLSRLPGACVIGAYGAFVAVLLGVW
jgi:cation:H+ antiporter